MATDRGPFSEQDRLRASIAELQKRKTRSTSPHERKKLGKEIEMKYKKLRRLTDRVRHKTHEKREKLTADFAGL